jgi:hypothetical protein
MTGLDPGTGPHHRDCHRGHGQATERACRRPGARDPPGRRDAGSDGRMEHAPARQSGLVERVRRSRVTESEAELATLAFLRVMPSRAHRRCAATVSARTGASSRAGCRSWSAFSITAISMSARSRSWRAAGRRPSRRLSQGVHAPCARGHPRLHRGAEVLPRTPVPAAMSSAVSQACERNRDPILACIAPLFAGEPRRGNRQRHRPARRLVRAAPAAPAWVTTDLPANHDGIRAWIEASGAANLEGPLALDTLQEPWPELGDADAAFSANTAHIMPEPAVLAMFEGLGAGSRWRAVLPVRALHGAGPAHQREQPALRCGLRAQGAGMGVRDSAWLLQVAQSRASCSRTSSRCRRTTACWSGADMIDLPAAADVFAAAARIAPFIHRTPVLTSSGLDAQFGGRLFFKCENFQASGAFKARGAFNAVLSLDAGQRRRGVATHSSGNHGAALALAAARRGIPAWVVVPTDASGFKRRRSRATARRRRLRTRPGEPGGEARGDVAASAARPWFTLTTMPRSSRARARPRWSCSRRRGRSICCWRRSAAAGWCRAARWRPRHLSRRTRHRRRAGRRR